MTPQGKSWLTVPVKHNTGQLIYEVEVSDPAWQAKHWERIKQTYKQTPYFKTYAPEFESFYRGPIQLNLSAANVTLIGIVNEFLGIQTIISDSRKFPRELDPSERLLHIVKKLGASTYLSGPAAQSYLNEALFIAEGVQINYMDYANYPSYHQQSEIFAHDVSVLDLIFNCGPESSAYMKSFNN